MTLTKRLDYPDIFKGIAILLMVIGHCGGDNWFVGFVYGFHMPAFFFITGFLTDFKKGTTVSFAVKRFLTLLVPFFFICFLFLSIKSLLLLIPGYVSPFGWQDISYGDALRLLFTRGDAYSQPLGAMWFLPALFFASFIMKFLVRACEGKRWLVFIFSSILCAFGFYLISIEYADFIWLLRPKHVLIAQYFVCLGWLVGQSPLVRKYLNKDHIQVPAVCFAITLTLSLLLALVGHYRLDMSECFYPKPTWLVLVSPLSGSLMLLSLSVLISALPKYAVKPFVYLGRASLAIMVFHFLGMKLFGLFLVGIGHYQYQAILPVVPPDGALGIVRFAYVVVSIAFSIGLYEGLRRIPVVNGLFGLNPRYANIAGEAVENKIIELAKEPDTGI